MREYTLGELIRADIRMWANLWSPASTGQNLDLITSAKMISSFLGLRAAIIYRLSHYLQQMGVRFLPQFLYRLNVMLHGIDIPPGVPIGPGLYIAHPVGTVIMAERIGSGVTLVSGVTLGLRTQFGFPTLGDNVYVGAGARVLGRITIGNNVNIGANAVVLRDVPDNSTAIGVPAQIRPAAPRTETY